MLAVATPVKTRFHKSPPSAAIASRRMTEAQWSKRTIDDVLADMDAHTDALSKSKKDALAFLQRAGIADRHGNLAEPYRS